MIQNTMETNDRLDLIKLVMKEEVYKALISMKLYKAPSPDGFQPIFLKMFWKKVGDDVWNFEKDAFSMGNFDPKATKTWLS